jgi:broad specificity phosphatase PhoE
MPINTNILLIRHAEKPADQSDSGLNLAGQARAMAYIVYFQNFKINSKLIKLDYLFATAVSGHSNRPYLTIQPLAQTLTLPIDNHFMNTDEEVAALANYLQTDPKFNNANILICWHHEKLLQIADALGAPHHTLPDDWPDPVYGWLIQLSFDANGRLAESITIEEKLMYDDYEYQGR